jgi:hypothetical protein
MYNRLAQGEDVELLVGFYDINLPWYGPAVTTSP